MDWHKLQKTLFELDPTDPREDLAKLQASIQSPVAKDANVAMDYLNESINVKEGSLALDKDYTVNDFAALAGVKLDERRQQKGEAGQLKGKDKVPTIPAGSTKNVTRDKLVGDSTDNDDRVKALESRVEALEAIILEMAKKKKPEVPKQRNPVAAFAQRSGTGTHKDKAKVLPRKEKHKGKSYAMESLKEELMRRLNDKNQ